MAGPSLLMTGLGAQHARSLNDSKLRLLLGATLFILSPLIALKKGKEEKENEENEQQHQQRNSFMEYLEEGEKEGGEDILGALGRFAVVFGNNYWDYLCLGLFSGYSSGLLGIGGGILMTTYMSLKGDMSQLTAVATSLAAIVPIGFYLFIYLFMYLFISLFLYLFYSLIYQLFSSFL